MVWCVPRDGAMRCSRLVLGLILPDLYHCSPSGTEDCTLLLPDYDLRSLVLTTLFQALNQCGGSGMFIPDPGSWFLPIPDPGSRIPNLGSRISDPKTVTKERGEKKFVIILYFVFTNFTKLNIMLFLKCQRKKFEPIFKELLKFLPKKFSICSQIYGFGIRDPRSGIRDPEKTYSGSRIQDPDPGVKKERVPDPDPQHCFKSSSSQAYSKYPEVFPQSTVYCI